MIATTPLTDNEHWAQIPPGNLVAFRDGETIALGETATVAQDYPRRGATTAARVRNSSSPPHRRA